MQIGHWAVVELLAAVGADTAEYGQGEAIALANEVARQAGGSEVVLLASCPTWFATTVTPHLLRLGVEVAALAPMSRQLVFAE